MQLARSTGPVSPLLTSASADRPDVASLKQIIIGS